MASRRKAPLQPNRGSTNRLSGKGVRPHRGRALQAGSSWYTHAVHPWRLGPQAATKDTRRHLRPSRRPKDTCREGLPTRFLLANGSGGLQGHRTAVRGVPVLRSTNSPSGAGTTDHPHHVDFCRLAPVHGGAAPTSTRGLHSPPRSS
jgi:hypothetical protein